MMRSDNERMPLYYSQYPVWSRLVGGSDLTGVTLFGEEELSEMRELLRAFVARNQEGAMPWQQSDAVAADVARCGRASTSMGMRRQSRSQRTRA